MGRWQGVSPSSSTRKSGHSAASVILKSLCLSSNSVTFTRPARCVSGVKSVNWRHCASLVYLYKIRHSPLYKIHFIHLPLYTTTAPTPVYHHHSYSPSPSPCPPALIHSRLALMSFKPSRLKSPLTKMGFWSLPVHHQMARCALLLLCL